MRKEDRRWERDTLNKNGYHTNTVAKRKKDLQKVSQELRKTMKKVSYKGSVADLLNR